MKHDAQGFLLGDRINAPTSNASPAIAVLGAVRRDVSVIRRLLESRGSGQSARSPGGARTSSGMSSTARAAVSATARRAAADGVARATAGRGPATAPMMRDARGRFIRSASVRDPGSTSVKAVVAAPASASRSTGRLVTSADGRAVAGSERDSRGRFAGGGGGGGSDYAGQNVIGKIASSLDGISDAVTGAENIDPTISALKEVRDAVSPVGRGFMALHNRLAERKKERWYSRILKAITGRKGDASASGGGDVTRGSFLGTFMGELMGNAARMLPAILAGAGGLLLKGLGLLGAFGIGQYIGGKIYEWLDKSGILNKVFDAFDAVGSWFKEKAGQFSKGAGEQQNGPGNTKLPPAASLTQKAGRFAGAVGSLFSRSKATAQGYAAGNIDGLDDAQTRALVASTVMTESAGGRTDVVNGAGYMGRYQAGAAWLADAGLIRGGSKAVREAMARDGFRNEYKWGESGGMTRFLKDRGNWNKGLSYEAYLASPEVQDLAFRDNSSAAYRQLMAEGSINKSTPMNVVAGALKARHLAGMGGARSVLAGGTGAADANGTTARKYFNDVAADRHGFGAAFSSTIPAVKPAAVPMTAPDKPAVVQAPPVPERLGSARQTPVVISKDDVNQDVRDRRLAHIVTGGIGG